MVTTSWSCESFDLVRGPKEGQTAPHPKITGVFKAHQVCHEDQVRSYFAQPDSIGPPFQLEKGS